MITLYRGANYSKVEANEYVGLSTDKKPLDVPNGSIFNETDNSKIYRYNAAGKEWLEWKTTVEPEPEQPESGG